MLVFHCDAVAVGLADFARRCVLLDEDLVENLFILA